MYNLTVAEAHTFYVGDGQWLVHNEPPTYYRGGQTADLTPKPGELKIKDGIVQPTRGVSLHTDSQHLQKFGGAHPVTQIPDELEIVQQGKDPNHYEIRPKQPMPESKFNELLKQVKFGEPCP